MKMATRNETNDTADVTVLLGALEVMDDFHDEFMPLKCQSCSNIVLGGGNIVLGGGFCRVCEAEGACVCKFCQEPIRKTVVRSPGKKARTIRGARCGQCLVVVYCDRACQRAHWKQHKPRCAGFDKRTLSNYLSASLFK